MKKKEKEITVREEILLNIKKEIKEEADLFLLMRKKNETEKKSKSKEKKRNKDKYRDKKEKKYHKEEKNE